MSKREPLKIGTKIKFTGPCVQRESIGRNMRDIAFLCWDEAKATVTKLGEYEGSLYVEGKSFVGWISRRQVTKILVPRKKPCPPQGERVDKYASKFSVETGVAALYGSRAEACHKLKLSFGSVMHLVELKPSEVIVDREELQTSLGNMFAIRFPEVKGVERLRALNCFLDHFGMADQGSAQ